MSAKQKIMKLLRESDPGLTVEEAIYKLEVLRRIELGDAQLDRGEGIDHDAMVAKWSEDAQEVPSDVVAPGGRRSPQRRMVHRVRKTKPKNG